MMTSDLQGPLSAMDNGPFGYFDTKPENNTKRERENRAGGTRPEIHSFPS